MAQSSRNALIEWLCLAALLLLVGAVAVAHAYLAPLTTGPDELAHYEYLNFIAEHGRLPLTPAERTQASYKSDQPPLYHLLAALPAAAINTDGPSLLKRVSDGPRRQLIERTRHAWGLYNTLNEQWPYRGEVLRWQVGRWVAIFFGVLTVLTTYLLARWFFAGRWPLALAVAATVAFIPRFTLTGSMLNYETTLAFFAALFLWALLRMSEWTNLRINESTNLRNNQSLLHSSSFILHPFIVGLLAGLAIVTKLSAIILPLEIAIAFWLIGRAAGLPWQTWLRWLASAAVGTLLPVGAWYGFVVAHFNTIAQDGLWTGLLRPLIAADSSDATTNRLLSLLTGGEAGFTAAIENLDSGPPWEWAATFYRTFFSVGIEGVQPWGTQALIIAGALLAVAAAGLIVVWVGAGAQSSKGARGQGAREKNLSQPATRNPQPIIYNSQFAIHNSKLALSLLLLHLLLPLLLPLIRYAATFSLADTAQGRHALFIAAPALALLLTWGLLSAAEQFAIRNSQFTIAKFAPLLTVLPPLFLFGWSLAQLQTMTWAYLPPLPVTSQPARVPPLQHRLDAALSPYVTLLGYNSQIDAATRLLRVDLWWRAEAVSPVDYLTHAVLLDAADRALAQWQGHPAGGRYPTRAWDPGDIVQDTLWLPLGGLDAGEVSLALRLTPTAAHYPPEAETGWLTLGRVTVPESTLPIFESVLPLPELGVAAGYTAWKEGQPITQPQPLRYRETLAVSLPPLPESFSRTVQMAVDTPAGPLAFDPALLSDTQAIFMVGPDWPGGDYRLQAAISDGQQNDYSAKSNVIAHVTDRWQRDFAPPQPGRPVAANFAGQVELLGYDLPATRAAPGGGLPLTLYWRGLDWLGDDLTIFTKLLKADDLSQHGGRDRLPREGYRTLFWAPGEIITDPFGLPVDAAAPDGIYVINVGLYRTTNGQAVSLPLVVDGQPVEATSLNLGPVKIGDTPPGLTVESARPQTTLNQPFGAAPNLTLLGYDLSQESGDRSQEPGGDADNSPNSSHSPNSTNSLTLKLYWQSESPLPLDYTTFVHLRDAAGNTVAQKDQPPLAGAYPTSLWEPGEIIADEITVPLPPDLPAGDYALVVGLYDFNTFQRLPVPGNPANEVTLTTVTAGSP